MGDYVNQAGKGNNFSPAELEQLAGVEYYHVRHCACGAEVFHDGMRAGCRECREEDAKAEGWQCAQCRPYQYADLLKRGLAGPLAGPLTISWQDLGTVALVAWVLGMVMGWWITR